MDEGLFLAIHNTGYVNSLVSFNINYDLVGTNQGKITSFTATVAANIDGENRDITDILLQIESAVLEIQGQNLVLNILNRSVYDGAGNTFVYYLVEEVTIFIPGTNPEGLTSVSFTPVLNNLKFSNNDYNPLISNAIKNRASLVQMSSARNETTINPQNLESLISTSASKAEISDSLYYDTGWSNARYDGSKTSANDFGGIEPGILGRSFQGEVNTTSTSNLLICSQSVGQRVIEDLLHTGPSDLPDFIERDSTIVVGTSAIDNNTVTFQYEPKANISTTDVAVVVGSIITIQSEKMRIEKFLEDSFLQVERGYLDTTPTGHSSGMTISSSAFTRVFNFEDNNSKISVVDNANLYVADTDVVLGTDKFGVVHSKFDCNE